jgi:ribosomal protein L5
MKPYLEKLIKYENLNKFGLSNLEEKIGIIKLTLNISIRDQIYEYSSNYTKSLFLLEHITSRRSYIRSYVSKMRGRGKKATFCTLQVSLRGVELLNFLKIFHNFAQIKIIRKNIILKNILNDNLLSLEIDDVSIFPGIEEDFLNWRYPLSLNLVLNVSKNDNLKNAQALIISRNYNLHLINQLESE